MNTTPDCLHSWKVPSGWVGENLPEVPSTPQGFNKTIAKTAAASQRRQNKGKGGGYEYHYSILPQKAQAALIKKYPEIIFKDGLKQPLIDDSTKSNREDLWDYYSRKSDEAKSAAVIKG